MQNYRYLIIPFLSLILCQIVKFIIESIQNKQFKWGRLFNGSGGMPSTHTTFSFSLTFTLGYTLGFDSPIFAVALIFSMIVSYDSMGVRLESERQAIAINQLVDNIFAGKPATWYKHLKEELGHQPLEVVVGVAFAFVTSTILNILL